MKTEFLLTLYDNEKNRDKVRYFHRIEIMFDDEDNPLPDEWFSFWSDSIPWGSTIKITLETV